MQQGRASIDSSKRKAGADVDLNGAGDRMTKDVEKTKTGHICPQQSQPPETNGEVWHRKDLPLVWEYQVTECLKKLLNVDKPMGAEVLRKLNGVVARMSSVFKGSGDLWGFQRTRSEFHCYLQEQQGGGSGEIQAGHPHFCPLGRWHNKSSWKPFPNTLRTRR